MLANRLVISLGLAAMVAACAQQEEARRVAPEPVFDKFGGGACEEGYVYVPGTVPTLDRCVPEDECEEAYSVTTSAVLECPPPRRERTPGSGDNDRPEEPRDPTGRPAGPVGMTSDATTSAPGT